MAGRKASNDPAQKFGVSMAAEYWEYAGLFMAGSENASAQVREVIDELRKFRPAARGTDGRLHFVTRKSKKARAKRIPKWITLLALEQGKNPRDLLIEMAEAFRKSLK